MIALGLTDPGARLAAPLHCEAGVVTAPAGDRATRLALQIQVHRALPVFLPFKGQPSLKDARRWAEAHPRHVARARLLLRGMGQMTALFSRPVAVPPTGTGADWLRARTARHQEATRLTAHLDRLAKSDAPEAHRIQVAKDRVALHILAPMDKMDAETQAWSARLADADSATSGWQATVTGGWPPAAFWSLPEEEHTLHDPI